MSNITKYVHPDYTEVYEGKRYKIGIQGAIDHILGVRKTYPDIRLKIDRQIEEGEWLATCFTMKGTHMGEWAGIKPTNKKITVTGINVDRLFDGKLM